MLYDDPDNVRLSIDQIQSKEYQINNRLEELQPLRIGLKRDSLQPGITRRNTNHNQIVMKHNQSLLGQGGSSASHLMMVNNNG